MSCHSVLFFRKKNKKLARQKLALLAEHISISDVTGSMVKSAIENMAIHDVEDGMEYYAARGSKCQCIITEDVKDLYFSEIEVLTCERFFEKYLTHKK